MSNALALAGVTAVLKELIDSGLSEHNVLGVLGTQVGVSSIPPDSVPIAKDSTPCINVYLHQVSLNTAYRNVDLPSRDDRGRRTLNPPLALDLHYLLTAYGFGELHAEVLLGHALLALHETPVLGRARIRAVLNPSPPPIVLAPSVREAMRGTALPEQLEMLKITPTTMSSEEMSRLWSAFHAHYRPTAALQVSVVLIERERPAVSALPVLRRGALDQGVDVTPSLTPPYPTLASVLAPAHATPSVLNLGEALEVRGHHLAGRSRSLVFRNGRFGILHEPGLPDGVDDTPLNLTLPSSQSAVWPAGVYFVELRVTRPGEATPRMSNSLPIALAPSIVLASVVMTRVTNTLRVTLDCTPMVRVGQSVTLSMDSQEALASPFTANTSRLSFTFEAAPPAGTQPLLRLRVDGIESVAVNRAAQPPSFFNHRVTLP